MRRNKVMMNSRKLINHLKNLDKILFYSEYKNIHSILRLFRCGEMKSNKMGGKNGFF